MQPRELVLQGLTAFTAPTRVDFADARLFAIVGATGAGKSSLLDAMTVALYGRVPRLGRGELAPVMTTGSDLCRVGLTFDVRGRTYRAVREVRRVARGVTTPEAALDELDAEGTVLQPLAGSADDVTAAVTALLGLSFDEFCKAVLLPQGQFAEVLHAQPAKRQELLATLLGTAVYEQVKVLAGQEARGAVARADQIARQVADLGDVSEEAVAAARGRVAVLEALEEALARDAEALEEAREAHRLEREHERAALAVVTRLCGVGRPPEGLVDLSARVSTAEELLAKHALAAAEAGAGLAVAQDALEQLGDGVALAGVVARHAEVGRLAAESLAAAGRVPELAAAAAALEGGVGEAERASHQAQVAVLALRREHAAAQAAVGLGAGDPCPVCDRVLQDTPHLELPADLDAAEQQATAALRAAAKAATLLDRARADLSGGRAAAAEAAGRASDAAAAAADLPGAEAARAALVAIAGQKEVVGRVQAEAREATAALEGVRERRMALDEEAARLRATFDRARMAVGDLEPPEPPDDPRWGSDGEAGGQAAPDGGRSRLGQDLAVAWEALAGWAEHLAEDHRARARAAAEAQGRIQARGGAVRARMESACAEAGVEVRTGKPLESAVAARAQAQSRALAVAEAAERAARLREEEVAARHQGEVAEVLARLLRADAFPRWLLDQATRQLVQGATGHLLALSRDRYELDLDDRGGITVVDLASAGQRRSVKTLSGGETFLAALALALSLAEQIAAQAAGPVALESLFIDEGFGALDADALDVAADAIEQLGAGDRVVGVITHLPDLAERLPARFRVTRTPGGSTVDRIAG